MKAAIVLFFAAIVAIAFAQCPETEITNPLQGIDKALHSLEFLLGGTVKYNLTQHTLYKDQTIAVSLLNDTSAAWKFNGDACDFNSTGGANPKWADTVSAEPFCDRSVVSTLDFKDDFVNCAQLIKGTQDISGVAYDTYSGVFASMLVNPVGTVASVNIFRTTFIKKRFTIKLQKEITLTTTLNISAPQNVFSAGAVLQTYDYVNSRVQVGFFTTQSTSATYSLVAQTGTHTGPRPVTVVTNPSTPEFQCPAGLPNCQTWLLEINPNGGCSWNQETYEAKFTVNCGGCLLQGNEVVVTHLISLTDVCDIVELQFDVTGSVNLYSDTGRTTALAQPVSIDTDAYVRATLSTTFAPMIDVDLRTFKICSYTPSETCTGAPNEKTLVNAYSVTTAGGFFNINPTALDGVTITAGNTVNFDFDMGVVFSTDAIDQNYLNTADGQILFEFTFDVKYVNKKKRMTLAAKSSNAVETESIAVPAAGFKVAANINNENSASVAQASTIVLLAIVSLFFFFF